MAPGFFFFFFFSFHLPTSLRVCVVLCFIVLRDFRIVWLLSDISENPRVLSFFSAAVSSILFFIFLSSSSSSSSSSSFFLSLLFCSLLFQFLPLPWCCLRISFGLRSTIPRIHGADTWRLSTHIHHDPFAYCKPSLSLA